MLTTLDLILSKVPGSISRETCEVLTERAAAVPDDGLILDLCPGAGRSTVVLSTSLETEENTSAKVLAVDTHITNPLSSTPQEDGTLGQFFHNLRQFRVLHRVTPIVDSIGVIPQIFNKRSANLVVVQCPLAILNVDDTMHLAIEVAQFSVRKNGKIIVICPGSVDFSDFSRFVSSRFTEGFDLVSKTDQVLVYEFTEAAPALRPAKRTVNKPESEVE